MISRWLRWMERRGSHRSISRDGTPYLERYFLLRLGGVGMFLHLFLASDLDEVHDHPWPWFRLILKGRYREWYHDGSFIECGPGHVVLWRDAKVLHRVELIDGPVWTLFLHGRRCRRWGFLEHGKWSPADDTRPSTLTQGRLLPRYPTRPA